MEDIDEIAAAFGTIVRLMVDLPNAVSVKVSGTPPTIISIAVAPADVGKVIGQGGRTARSMRIMLQAMAMTRKRRISLDIIELRAETEPEARV